MNRPGTSTPVSALLLPAGNGLLVLGLLLSVYLAFAWGEMAGIAMGRDKSALGGLFVVLFFMLLRWVTLALVLGIAVFAGGFAGLLEGGRWRVMAWVLGMHLLLGAGSYLGFTWVSQGLMQDQALPQRFAWLFGIVLPLPALVAGGWALNREWVSRWPRLALAVALGVLLAHALVYRAQLRDMQRSNERLDALRQSSS